MITVVGDARAGNPVSRVLWAVAAVLAVAGITLLVTGMARFGDATNTRDRADRARRDAVGAAARTEAIERGANSPISQAETVASSVSDIVEAGDTLITHSASTSDVLSRAVGLANDGNVDAARGIYRGEAAASVRGLEAELATARAALATAQQAVAELVGPPP